MEDKTEEFNSILLILEKRAKSVRITMLIFVYLLLTAMICVVAGIISIKSKNENAISNFVSTFIKKDGIDLSSFVQATFAEQFQLDLESSQKNTNRKDLSEIKEEIKNLGPAFRYQPYHYPRGTSEKIADSVASIIISFSLLVFIGFVMKASIMFIKYYMQLGNDYENQKIAFLLSKGNIESFDKILLSLRNHNVNFEKTPSLPQDKIITALINTVNGLAVKNRNPDKNTTN